MLVASTQRVNRVFQAVAIPHLMGDPNLPLTDERALRRRLTEQALDLLTTPGG